MIHTKDNISIMDRPAYPNKIISQFDQAKIKAGHFVRKIQLKKKNTKNPPR